MRVPRKQPPISGSNEVLFELLHAGILAAESAVVSRWCTTISAVLFRKCAPTTVGPGVSDRNSGPLLSEMNVLRGVSEGIASRSVVLRIIDAGSLIRQRCTPTNHRISS